MPKQHTFAILAYKESPYLEECIASLLKQSVQSEIILATATPNQFLEKIARKYHLPLHINTGEKGLAADWNFALNQAKTEYVTLAHQDDIYLPNYTQVMLQDLEKHPDLQQKHVHLRFSLLYSQALTLLLHQWFLTLPYQMV